MTEVKSGPAYWLDLFTGKTWDEFLRAGGTVSGFRESRRRSVSQLRRGDYLLCYLTGVSRFIGLLEVTGDPYRDASPIWEDDPFPSRVPVRVVARLTPETGVPVADLRDRLSMFRNMKTRNAWTGSFRGSPARWQDADGKAVVEAVLSAERSPVERPVDQRKLARRPRMVRSRIGPVTIPEPTPEEVVEAPTPLVSGAVPDAAPVRAHTEIQWLLLKLGSDMGLDVWVASNDRGGEYGGQPFASIPRIRANLPRQFDDATSRTIALIDVLWLQRNTIVAAFEVESTTSIYSGLLRMSDLLSTQPNLNIPLYLVAPDDRRRKVVEEVNRPTFSRLEPPLAQVCRYTSPSPYCANGSSRLANWSSTSSRTSSTRFRSPARSKSDAHRSG